MDRRDPFQPLSKSGPFAKKLVSVALRLAGRRAVFRAAFLMSLALSAAGCLALAERPTNEIGGECESSKHCPSIGHCEHLDGDDSPGICLPDNVECLERVSPQCNGYICEVDLGYCHRSCETLGACVEGYTCEYDYGGDKGECLPDEVAQTECSATDLSACGGYSCYESGSCRGTCFDPGDCAPNYRCTDTYDCVPG